ncbi:MAG: hypothetical protein ACO1RT_05440 [Planctomycetaceae bacterium]
MQTNRLWTIHLTALIALAVWTAIDPLFLTMVGLRSTANAAQIVGELRLAGAVVIAAVASMSLVLLLTNILGRRGDPRYRSTRQLLAITTVIALWCSLFVHHEAIAWQGKRARFALRVEQLEAVAAPLRGAWPEEDGELPQIGPFMAYPFGRPVTLVLLQAPRIDRQPVYVSAIERCPDGAIKLQLTGADGGDWAEWHPPGSRPRSFVGGLCDPHELRTATAIGDGWYLVRYKSPSAA